MHTIRTFILRLLVDPAEPEALRGALRALPEGKAEPFTGEQMLLALLRRPTGQAERRSDENAETGSVECPK